MHMSCGLPIIRGLVHVQERDESADLDQLNPFRTHDGAQYQFHCLTTLTCLPGNRITGKCLQN